MPDALTTMSFAYAGRNARMAEEENLERLQIAKIPAFVSPCTSQSLPEKKDLPCKIVEYFDMRKIWTLALLVLALLAAGNGVAEVPDLLGNWTGSGEQYFKAEGYTEGLWFNMTVVEQKSRLFTGNLTYELNGTETVEGFAGAIGPDNRNILYCRIQRGLRPGDDPLRERD